MARDYVAEIESLRTRSGNNLWRTPYDVADLGRARTSKEQSGVLLSDVFVIRLVTILEVATRTWIAALVDHGEPYISRANDLFKRSGIKLDFGTARAITGKRITLGELIAHTVSTNSIGDIDTSLSALLDASPKQQLDGIKDPWMDAIGPSDPLVPDPDETYRMLQRLFECRHIVVHELPSAPPYAEEDVEKFISHSFGFVTGMDVLIGAAIGSTALTQGDMNEEAEYKGNAAQERLRAIIDALDPDGSDRELQAAQSAWNAYRDAHANYRSGITIRCTEASLPCFGGHHMRPPPMHGSTSWNG